MEAVLREEISLEELSDDDVVHELFHLLREREQARIRYEETVDQMNDCLFQLDLHGNCIFLSPAWPSLTGHPLEGSVGTPFQEYFHPDGSALLQSTLLKVIEEKSSTVHYCELKNKDDHHLASCLGMKLRAVLNENGDVVGVRGVLSNETQRKTLEESLRLVVAAFENTSEGILITSFDQKIVKVNKSFTKITGYNEREVLGLSPKLLSSGIHDRRFYTDMWDSIRRTGGWKGEVWNRRKDGSIYPELLSINTLTSAGGKISHYVAMFTDISSVKDAETVANTDPITKLPNRSVFYDRLSHAIALADQEKRKVGVLCVDLDNFKNINDSLGHTFGDKIIKETAHRLSRAVSKGETLARLGGDEFIVIVENFKETSDLTSRGEKLLSCFQKPFKVDGHEIFVSASMGISIFPEDGNSPDILLKHADTAMYKAKEQGKNHFQFYREEMNAGVLQRLMIESRLHNAIEEKELFMLYQPQINLATGEMTGAEALIRWNSAQLGSISPAQFIPMAEETGLIGSIGHWAFLESCSKIAGAKDLPPGFCISVNLSAKQLKNPGLLEDIQNILTETGVSPHNV
ncbi:MAG TPA: diguanylate cyclase, partial [Ignavibacteriaceae bacterium]